MNNFPIFLSEIPNGQVHYGLKGRPNAYKNLSILFMSKEAFRAMVSEQPELSHQINAPAPRTPQDIKRGIDIVTGGPASPFEPITINYDARKNRAAITSGDPESIRALLALGANHIPLMIRNDQTSAFRNRYGTTGPAEPAANFFGDKNRACRAFAEGLPVAMAMGIERDIEEGATMNGTVGSLHKTCSEYKRLIAQQIEPIETRVKAYAIGGMVASVVGHQSSLRRFFALAIGGKPVALAPAEKVAQQQAEDSATWHHRQTHLIRYMERLDRVILEGTDRIGSSFLEQPLRCTPDIEFHLWPTPRSTPNIPAPRSPRAGAGTGPRM